MIRTICRNFALLATLSVGLSATTAQAAFIGSFGINANTPSLLPNNDLASATSFVIGSMATNGVTSGGFNGIGLITGTPFSGSTLIIGNSTAFTFSNATFGTFQETAAPIQTSLGMIGGVVTSRAFFVLGTYVGGPVGTTPTPASFTVSFTQNGGPNTSVSASGTLDIPPTVPEPASVAMMGLGLAGVVGFVRFRRRAITA